MSIRTRGYLGIDLGSRAIKMAQIEQTDGQIRLIDAVVIRRNANWNLTDQPIQAPCSSAPELAAAKRVGTRFSGHQAASTMTMGLCDVRQVAMIATDDEQESREQIVQQLKTVERFGIQPRQFDYWTLPEAWSQGEPKSYVLSLRQDWAEQFAEDQYRAHLKTRCIDGLPMALARAAEWAVPSRHRGPIAVLDWGYSRATFCVVLAGKPVFVRMLRGGGYERVVKTVAESLNLTHDEAESLLQTRGLSPEPDGCTDRVESVLSGILTAPLQCLFDELNRTLRFLKIDRRKEFPSCLLLFGAGALLKHVPAWFQQRTGLDVAPWTWNGNTSIGGSQGPIPAPLVAVAMAMSALAWRTP